MQLATPATDPTAPTATQLVTLLERHRAALPFADEELARHQALRIALVERHTRSEEALNAWRSAISQRWECEVRAQRSYRATLRLLDSAGEERLVYNDLIEVAPITTAELLSATRRLAASLALLQPPPTFAASSRAELHAAADALETAIERTNQCENIRHQMLLEERLTGHMYLRTCAKTHAMIARHFDSGLPYEG